jgi:hypothetical protein
METIKTLISCKKFLYDKAKERAKSLGKPFSTYVSDLIRKDLGVK